MRLLKLQLLLFMLILPVLKTQAALPFTIAKPGKVYAVGKQVWIYEDASGEKTIEDINHESQFVLGKDPIPNFGITSSNFWLRLELVNNTGKEDLLLLIENPIIDEVEFYYTDSQGNIRSDVSGEHKTFASRTIQHSNYIFSLPLKNNERSICYLKIKSNDQLQLPLFVGTEEAIYQRLLLRDLLFGIYAGIIAVMILYNLFVYLSVKDNSYIYYVFFILFVGLSQATLEGLGFRFLWPGSPWMAINSTVIIPALSGVTTGLFMKSFLQTARYAPVLDKIINSFIGGYIIALIACLLGFNQFGLQLLHVAGAGGSFFALYVGYRIHKLGNRSGRFFLIANSIFLLAVIGFVLRNVNIIPYNTFTSIILELGSALQVILLSFALADKINTLKVEKEHSQAMALLASRENERLITEQNIMLEAKVYERTRELQFTNGELINTLHKLKDTQSQLVEAEKMASLGQLTAGIAHEINNPINFVSSNVKPLQMDIDDLFAVIAKYEELDLTASPAEKLKEIENFKRKIDLEYVGEEIKSLLRGIEDGATRTAEIVKGLRNFSRLDESELKLADIHTCIDSTLVVLKHSIPNGANIVRDFSSVPQIECYPGKLNQALLNLLNNAFHAICKKTNFIEHTVTISTSYVDEMVMIAISDTGIGMPEEVKEKIFEPFFTTKEVGEGTGLGLSIVYKIIEKHQGKIEVSSVPDIGTTFTLLLPKQLETKQKIFINELVQS
ncbi:sensor histidine kinase [Solitalea canadensis]|uniref:histidine kinase n=1 Tax=Solitalea canadensis (strain ATCC 29591 / DSM 3403 / JCM 21819 / LMG 8368 / NBRC 15130 / NCIMB 12057 / USAM 9D) TaxID=929556 RepID=H8KPF9_SOLCM|nr:7TM diverse intracellular signaling domain-containing protein [Solitalea canadensis]AFD05857.1 histidine kinase,7TM-containing protein possibly involved in signal transduction,histidine kinase [Solitalea canadensis DSM 3403]